MKNLQRKYLFSDTYGGSSENPLLRPDPDAKITTDFHSQRREFIEREFDIYHDTQQTAHLLRMVLELDAEAMDTLYNEQLDRYAATSSGVFINVAPRDNDKDNGQPFYVATAREGRVRIVSTPLEALSPIKNEIESLDVLPNYSNRLYGVTEQFRSSYTPALLYEDHGYDLKPADISDIPDFRQDWHISYVDRFGNILTYIDDDQERLKILEHIGTTREDVELLLGGVANYDGISPTTGLAAATPGEVVIYENGKKNIDIARKWLPNEDAAERLLQSAYMRLDQPKVGDSIEFSKNSNLSLNT